jgi:hypothetical protein
MMWLRLVLLLSTVLIFAVTFGAVADSGFNWPRVFLTDLFAINWRSQFNTDLVIHLGLIGVWIAWREGFGSTGLVCGVFAVLWGGMFTFPYVLLASYRAEGNVRDILLGVHAVQRTAARISGVTS